VLPPHGAPDVVRNFPRREQLNLRLAAIKSNSALHLIV
jgi:hypothetical protein